MGKALIIKNADFSANAFDQIDIFENIPCTALDLSISTYTAEYVGDSVTVVATKTPSNATDIITWTSSDDNIATVDNGVITVHGIGTAIITATCGSCNTTVTVNQLSGIKVGGLYNADGVYPERVSSSNFAAALMVLSGQKAIGHPYTGNPHYNLRNAQSYGVQIIPIPYGAKYVLLHAKTETGVTGKYAYYDTENYTDYNGANFPTYLGSTSSYGLLYKRQIENANATGIMMRHSGSADAEEFDYLTFTAS